MAWSAALETDMKNIKKFGGVLLFALGAATAWPVPAAPTDKPAPAPAPPPTASVPVIPHTDTLAGMFRDGKLLLHLRMRYENADDDARQEAVDVGSLRTALGFRTASFHGLFGLAEVEDVLAVGTYDDGGTNRRMAPRYSAVVDPEGVELNQAYVGIDAIPHTVIQAGRQLILDRDAPFHRYLGNVLWRQNWQTFDAVSVANNSLPDTVVRFWYTWNVNRIFGEGHPTRGFDDEGLNGYLGNVVYTGLPFGRLEFYAYLLDFERSVVPAIRSFYPSTQTYGARFDGKYALNPKFDVLYIAEGAWQGDFSHNPTGNIDQPFLWGMLGGSYKLGGVVQSVTMKGQRGIPGRRRRREPLHHPARHRSCLPGLGRSLSEYARRRHPGCLSHFPGRGVGRQFHDRAPLVRFGQWQLQLRSRTRRAVDQDLPDQVHRRHQVRRLRRRSKRAQHRAQQRLGPGVRPAQGVGVAGVSLLMIESSAGANRLAPAGPLPSCPTAVATVSAAALLHG